MQKKKIVFIGAGNLATQLVGALYHVGENIVQVYSRTKENAKELAGKVNASFTNKLEEITREGDIYFFTVSDHVLEEVIRQIELPDKIWLHTAGSISINVFNIKSDNYGVFYPLQTFSKDRAADFHRIPVCLEASNQFTYDVMVQLAKKISEDIRNIDSEQRKTIHLAAVFACNFVNHLYARASELLRNKGIEPDILRPLIWETARKAQDQEPEKIQTGPAKRNDQNIIQKHLAMLDHNPEMQELYRMLTESIIKMNDR